MTAETSLSELSTADLYRISLDVINDSSRLSASHKLGYLPALEFRTAYRLAVRSETGRSLTKKELELILSFLGYRETRESKNGWNNTVTLYKAEKLLVSKPDAINKYTPADSPDWSC